MEPDQIVKNKIKQDLQQIADMLLLNGTLTECPGLVHGKMGIAVFFFHYAQYTGNELFADYAVDVIGEMISQLHVNSPADYERGIAGIGAGIDYMIRKGFLNVEDDICEDFDDRMFRAVMHDPWQDFSKYNGLTGYGRYWITRLRYPASSMPARECLLRITALIGERLPAIPVKEQVDVCRLLHDLQKIAGFERCNEFGEHCRKIWNFNDAPQDEMDMDPEQIPDLDRNKAPDNTGLLNGYAGEGMRRLAALDQKNHSSWALLL